MQMKLESKSILNKRKNRNVKKAEGFVNMRDQCLIVSDPGKYVEVSHGIIDSQAR